MKEKNDLIVRLEAISDCLIRNEVNECAEELTNLAPKLVALPVEFVELAGQKRISVPAEEILQRIHNFTEAFNRGDVVALADSIRYEMTDLIQYIDECGCL